MKTRILIRSMTLIVILIIFCTCTKEEEFDIPVKSVENDHALPYNDTEAVGYIDWTEDFTSIGNLLNNWSFFGTQKPNWNYALFDRYGLFDNNGNPPYGNTAVSKSPIGDGRGYIIQSDVYINLTNPSGTCICPSIGVSKVYNPTPINSSGKIDFGLMMRMQYIGAEVGNVPPYARHHTWLQLYALLEDGSIATPGDFVIPVDTYINGWHNMKIVVLHGGMAQFYLDNTLVWGTPKRIHKSLMVKKNLILGSTSPGIAGKAYHDFVKITYITPD